MDDVFGYDDNSGWEGLACPPLEEFTFNFDVTCDNLDFILDNPLLEEGDEEEDSTTPNAILDDHTNEVAGVDNKAKICYGNHGKGKQLKLNLNMADDHTNEVAGVDNKTKICYGNHGKGKQLKLNLNMAEIKAFLQEETEEVAEQKVKKRRIMDCYDCQSLRQKERSGLNRRLAVVDSKRKADFDVRLEAAGQKLHKSTCQPMQPKDMARLVHTNQHGAFDNERKADVDFRLEPSRHKLQESSKSACQPMRREDLMRLEYSNQLIVADNKMHTDYDSRYEATRRKLHVQYEQVREAKKQRQIQVIDFQKAVMEKPRHKAKGKASLRQKLMAMGTHKSNKMFQPFVY